MSEEKLKIGFVLWVDDFKEDGEPKEVKYSYEFPDIENETIVGLYRVFLETICMEIAKLEGALDVLDILGYDE